MHFHILLAALDLVPNHQYFSFLNFQFPITGVIPLITLFIYAVISWKLVLMRKKIANLEIPSHQQKLVIPIVDTKIPKFQSFLRAILPYQSIEKSSILDLFSIYVSYLPFTSSNIISVIISD